MFELLAAKIWKVSFQALIFHEFFFGLSLTHGSMEKYLVV